ncbi:MAG: N-acetylmuramoyl-L-alanine amidase [Candidatus Caenarcaniphilales bacterium]|nr:N-acetylmuramoyl-L-alanine amidase [Candidatus Caenarcaniphilales bacterium]
MMKAAQFLRLCSLCLGLLLSPLCAGAETKTSKINSITLEGEKIFVETDGKEKIEVKSFRLDSATPSNQRLVIDFQGGRWGDLNKRGFEKAPDLNFRHGQFSEDPPIARLVIEGPKDQLQKIDFAGKEGNKFVLKMNPRENTAIVSKPSPAAELQTEKTQDKTISTTQASTPIAQNSPLKTNYDVSVSEGNPSKIIIRAPALQEIKYRSFMLTNPDRLVIDLLNWQSPEPSRQPLAPNPQTALVMKIRGGKPDEKEKISRIVFDLARKKMNYVAVLSDDNRELTITLSNKQPSISQSLEKVKKTKTNFRVMIDAGHGGYDAGAIYAGVEEKTITLAIANELEKKLVAKGYSVSQTRHTDLFVSLEERVDMTNRYKPDLFISLHCNALQSDTDVDGIETYFYTPQSKLAAKYIHKGLLAASKAEDRHIRESRFMVIRETHFPSVLTELGFLSNPTERKSLGEKNYQKKLVDGLVEGIGEYFDNIDSLQVALLRQAETEN